MMITFSFDKKNKKAVIKLIEDCLQVSINDNSMFDIEPTHAVINNLSNKEERILFDILDKSNLTTDLQSTE